jgi:hypothetical protein
LSVCFSVFLFVFRIKVFSYRLLFKINWPRSPSLSLAIDLPHQNLLPDFMLLLTEINTFGKSIVLVSCCSICFLCFHILPHSAYLQTLNDMSFQETMKGSWRHDVSLNEGFCFALVLFYKLERVVMLTSVSETNKQPWHELKLSSCTNYTW